MDSISYNPNTHLDDSLFKVVKADHRGGLCFASSLSILTGMDVKDINWYITNLRLKKGFEPSVYEFLELYEADLNRSGGKSIPSRSYIPSTIGNISSIICRLGLIKFIS
jgi:hypothetical protein